MTRRTFRLRLPGEPWTVSVVSELAPLAPALWGEPLPHDDVPRLHVELAGLGPSVGETLGYFREGSGLRTRNFGVERGEAEAGVAVRVIPSTAVLAQAVRVGLEADLRARGWWSLHASAVRLGARAVAISAPSGTGKSTLSARCDRLGVPRFSDESTLVRLVDGRVELAAHPSQLVASDLGRVFEGAVLVRLGQGTGPAEVLTGVRAVSAVLQSIVRHDDSKEAARESLAFAAALAASWKVVRLPVPNDDSAVDRVRDLFGAA